MRGRKKKKKLSLTALCEKESTSHSSGCPGDSFALLYIIVHIYRAGRASRTNGRAIGETPLKYRIRFPLSFRHYHIHNLLAPLALCEEIYICVYRRNDVSATHRLYIVSSLCLTLSDEEILPFFISGTIRTSGTTDDRRVDLLRNC